MYAIRSYYGVEKQLYAGGLVAESALFQGYLENKAGKTDQQYCQHGDRIEFEG